MRVTWPRLDRIHKEDRGAVLFIVAISLVALIGMLVLTVDLGSLYAERRDMVRAADAAALAAAQECVKTANKFGTVGTQARTYAVANAGSTITSLYGSPSGSGVDPTTVNCSKGYVTVGYRIEKGLFFAPIFGFDNGAVTAHATAAWTLPGLVPLTIAKYWSDQTVVDCTPPHTAGTDFQPGQDCYVLFDNKADDSQNWGWLDISTWWGYPDTVDLNSNTCQGNPDLTNEVTNGLTYAEVSFPTPAWACNKSGNNDTAWMAMENLPLNSLRAMPISDNFCSKTSTPACTGKTFRHIIGFQTVKIFDAWDGPNAPTCGPNLPAPTNNQTCVHLQWQDARVNSIDVIRLVK